ncbi:MAG: hypothetical protein RMJ87_03860 [Cytophagales bacterium]|nr:hypothetical protein [Bernardetiaceae bacterium]MDW8204143.1 hypothetical protein [Cytophagales bacterium]
MKAYLGAIILLLTVGAFQCRKSVMPEDSQLIHVAYNETQCADPWQRGASDEETLRHVEHFLRERGIRFSGSSIVPAPANLIVCLACNCPSGRIIIGKIPVEDRPKIEQYGFSIHQ